MTSAICLNLDLSKILSPGNGLSHEKDKRRKLTDSKMLQLSQPVQSTAQSDLDRWLSLFSSLGSLMPCQMTLRHR